MAGKVGTLHLTNFRGGQNDTDPPTVIPDNQVTYARNVEFVNAPLGERRLGGSAIDLSGTGTFGTREYITWMHRHLPTSDESASQLWAMSVTGSATGYSIGYFTNVWNAVSPVDAIAIGGGGISGGFKQYELNSVSTHGKMFLAHYSSVDRLHVWDGTSLRRVGIAAASAAPTGANTAAVGTFSGTRYYRVRFTKQSAGITQLRSEPSAVLTFSPSGTNTGVTVTRPTAPGDSETHWELEASIDNANFYVIATTVLATTTATDTTALTTGYAVSGTLSPDRGLYAVPGSARFLAVDNDRLLLAGSLYDDTYGSRVSWTPVYGDTTAVGNDERVPTNTDNFIDLDNYEGGALTALHGPVNGFCWAFKNRHIYKLARTGNAANAYEAICVTKTCGAIKHSVVEAFDQRGDPALYFLDPFVGPTRVGKNGLESCGADVRNTWNTVNLDATGLTAWGLYYPRKRQIRWWVATGSNSSPLLVFVLHIDYQEDDIRGARKGFTIWDGTMATALCGCLYATDVTASSRSKDLVPYLGMSVSNAAQIWKTETTNADNGTAYDATIRTKAYAPVGIDTKFQVHNASFTAEAASSTSLDFSILADMGVRTTTVSSVSLAPEGSETHVVHKIDDLTDGEMNTVMLEISDPTSQSKLWRLAEMAVRISPGQTS